MCLLVLLVTVPVLPGALLSVTPTGASSGVIVNVTGTGFSTTAAQNIVTFTPAAGGAAQTSPASAVATLDATRGLRRLSVRVPSGLPAGRVDLKVDNTANGESSTGAGLDLVTLTLPQLSSASVGAQNVQVRIVGSANARFVAGSTRPAFGAGITVVGTIVESATSLVITINIAANATPGSRSVSVTTSTQSLLLTDGFTVTAAPPPNQPPTASTNGPYRGTTNLPVSFSSDGSTDPDNDRLTFLWNFGDGATSTEPNPTHTYTTAATFAVSLTVSDGRGGSNTSSTSALIEAPNQPPQITSTAPLTATEDTAYSYQIVANDPDNDALSYELVQFPAGMTVSSAGLIAWTPTGTQVGSQTVEVRVSDGRGGVDQQSFTIQVAALVRLTGITVAPPTLRFTEAGETAALAVTGQRSDQTTADLTAAATGTTYESANPGVATVSENGLVTAVANGSTSITARNTGFSAGVDVTVEIGPALDSLQLTPSLLTLRSIPASAPTTVTGIFADGSVRDLTTDPRTSFEILDTGVANVSAFGVVSAVTPGTTTLTARHRGRSATADITVLAATGTAFLRGEIFDDAKGLPLAGASVAVLPAGGASLAAPQPVGADERGRFELPVPAGAATVRITRNGYTSVDRSASPAGSAVDTLLDARLTPIDGRLNIVQSVFGGQASSTDGTATLQIPTGSLVADVTLRITPLSGQGLQGLLPIGWSPIAAVDMQPAGRAFTQAATLRLPHVDTLPAGAAVTLVRYDADTRRWLVQADGQVSGDRRTITAPVDSTGQFAFVVPDEAPLAPPAPVQGEPLGGLAAPSVPATSTATGTVTPRSAPPGENARALGTVVLAPPAPLPSGAVLRARVTEQFDLLDSSRVRPQPFVQDVVLYARPRLGNAGTLSARLPITPSLQFTIQQLSQGQVTLDVSIDEPSAARAIVGAAGGSLADGAGALLEVPAGSLPGDVAVALLPLPAGQLSIPAPDGFTLLGANLVDLVGATFTQPAALSIPRPADLDPSAQIVVAQVITDPTGGRRFALVGLGQIAGSRVAVQTTLGALVFAGVRSGGEYAFLKAAQPLGFVSGLVQGPTTSPQALALVTADTAPFAAVTPATGTFIVAGRAGVTTTVQAIEPLGATVSAPVSIAALNDVRTATVALSQAAPTVTATLPATGATNVALDTSIVVDFSKAMDPASITSATVSLAAGQSTVPAQLVLSANRRRLTISPSAPLSGLTAYTLSLTSGVRDQAGVALVAFTPRTFTTLDPSKPTALALGVITADLPDEDGLLLITGAPGAAAGGSIVVATNQRTQETSTVLALGDGSFRLRTPAVIGDEIALTLRGADGRDSTVAITQFTGANGVTSIGSAGGTITGAGGRIGRVLPRALASAGLFQITAGDSTPLPALPAQFATLDRFAVDITGATFRRLDALTLSESQNRFAPALALAAPFEVAGQLTVPADFLVSASLRFTANATDRDGVRRSTTGSTVVVAGGPDTGAVESGFGDQFPTVFITAPKEATPTQVVSVSAVAPAARIELDLPAATPPPAGDAVVLARTATLGGLAKLAFVDRLSRVDVNGAARLRTSGRQLPGVTVDGEYVAVSGPMAFVSGRVNGPAAIVSADGSPFIFETDGANGAFILPVPSGAAFTLRFTNAATGATLGDAAGQAPAAGVTANLGAVLAPVGGSLGVTLAVAGQSGVDINLPLVFTFSEPLDLGRVTPNAFVITEDATGVRVFGSLAVSDDRLQVAFVPQRRWRLGTKYRVGLTTALASANGATLAQPFSSEFTTFAARLVRSVQTAPARDVAVTGSSAAVATEAGLAVVDVANLTSAAVRAQVPLAGGAQGVALLPQPSFTDRTGTPRTGTFAAVASGAATGTGRLDIIDIGAAVPSPIGGAQVTTPAGQTAPAGVPPFPGTPNAVVLDAGLRALVSVQGLGVQAVDVSDAVPADAAAPGRALRTRYPQAGTEGINAAALLDGRVVTAGAQGVGSLDAATLVRSGVVSTTGDAAGVASLEAFPVDLNSDGTVATDERADLALVSNGVDGTLQIFSVPATGAPTLLSVVRFAEATQGVTVDAAERLAYVSIGSRGLAVVDLSGRMSIQPIDENRDALDDRILGIVDTPGSARRAALALDRGLGFVADGVGGLGIVQIAPARVRLQTVLRDPVRAVAGDEVAIDATRLGFTTDEAIRIVLEVALPPGTDAVMNLVAGNDDTGRPAVVFPNGSVSTPLAAGPNAVELVISRQLSRETPVGVRVQSGSASTVLSLDLSLRVPTIGNGRLLSLLVSPPTSTLNVTQPTAQLSVSGTLTDGSVLNLTPAAFGTTYQSSDPRVVTVSADGRVTAVAGGTAVITATNGSLSGSAVINSQAPVALSVLEVADSYVTLTSLAESMSARVRARMTDGSLVSSIGAIRASFASSNTAVVTVDSAGVMRAQGPGRATVTVSAGSFSATVEVTVELRVTPNLTAFDVLPITEPAATDTGEGDVTARVQGTGSLEGLPVQFQLPDGRRFTARTDRDGTAIARLFGLRTPGTFIVTASVTNPTGNALFTDSELLVVERRGSDGEPNDTVAAAVPATLARPVSGQLGGGDLRDLYRLGPKVGGTLSLSVVLSPETDPASVRLVVLSVSGAELASLRPPTRNARLQVPVGAGDVVVGIESSGPPVGYVLTSRLIQGPISVTAVTPTAGGPGTLVRITGTGFTTDAAVTRVLFGGAVGRVESVSPTSIDVTVPSTAVDGPLTVVSGAQRAEGPAFQVGRAGPMPRSANRSVLNPAAVRRDPVDGQLVDAEHVSVWLDPVASRADLELALPAIGGTIVGEIPAFNQYYVELAGNTSLDALEAARRQLTQVAGVRRVLRNTFASTAQSIDSRDRAGTWPNSTVARGVAYAQARVFEAIQAIRQTPPFTNAASLRPVRVAVLDTGFEPALLSEFTAPSGLRVVRLLRPDRFNANGGFSPSSSLFDRDGHGTTVTSVIAAVNDGVGTSGVLNSVFREGEEPFAVDVYDISAFRQGLDQQYIYGALADIVLDGNVDAVNLSFVAPYASPTQDFRDHLATYLDLVAPLAGRTVLVAAAGNEGVLASTFVPAAASLESPHVITVGATAVANFDGTGELVDARAVFGGEPYPGIPCSIIDEVPLAGSNCGAAVTLAAPGEDVLVASTLQESASGYLPPEQSVGTSLAAPIVTAVTALLQAIRPSAAPLTPAELGAILVDAADDISQTWGAGPMRRLNALNAVRTLLPPSPSQAVYVADDDADNGALPPGRVVAVDIDPMTGDRLGPTDRVIPLTLSRAGVTWTFTNPSSMAITPDGEKAYVVVSSTVPAIGDGVLEIGTRGGEPRDFIAFSGARLDSGPTAPNPPPVVVPTRRPGMVLSRDGRLLYVATGLTITIINTIEARVVRTMADLPDPYKARASLYPTELAARQLAIRNLVLAGTAGRPGQFIAALDITADGRRLYAAISTGGGPGSQPGAVFGIDIDLYRDVAQDQRGLQADLSTYFAVSAAPAAMAGAGTFAGGDEPADLAVDRNGAVYLVNGGLNFFESIPPDNLDLSRYLGVFAGSVVGTVTSGTGLAGMLNGLSSFDTLNSALFNELALDLKQQAESGVTLLSAPGFTGVFQPTPNGSLTNTWSFPSDVVFGWNPPSSNGGLIVNQFRFPTVFAKRPSSMAIDPIFGQRAIVALSQTGNFAVLDNYWQSLFDTPPGGTAKPVFATLPDTLFQGVVAVTPALRLDNHLWPRRGALGDALDRTVPSPDEALLFPWHVEYAQNGRFSIGTHAGVGRPRDITVPLPDWTREPVETALFPLTALGFNVSQGSTTGTDPSGNTVSVGQSYTFRRGGGAVSVIRERLIDQDLPEHADDAVAAANGTNRAWFATNPLCNGIENSGGTLPRCITPVVEHWFDYRPVSAPGDALQFTRPRGATIQPFVSFATPRFGDHVTRVQPVTITWRDARVREILVYVTDLGSDPASPVLTSVGGPVVVTLPPDALASQTFTDVFQSFFPVGVSPQEDHRYRLRVEANVAPGVDDNFFSETSIQVTFNESSAVGVPTRLLLEPMGLFYVTVPSEEPKQLTVRLRRTDGTVENVTNDPRTRYEWIRNPIPEDEKLDALLEFIKEELEEEGVELPELPDLPFALADIDVSATGEVTVNEPGLQVIFATHPDAPGLSNPTIVLAGFKLKEISLQPESVITTGSRWVMEAIGDAEEEKEEAEPKEEEEEEDDEPNPPLVLTDTDQDVAITTSVGYVRLVDVNFEFLGSGEISVSKIVEILQKIRETFADKGAKETVQEKVLKTLLPTVVSVAATEGLIDFGIDNFVVADFCDVPLDGCIKGVAPGVTNVNGTLDLNTVSLFGLYDYDLGLGEASDSVVTWVLPEVESAKLEPVVTVLRRGSPAEKEIRTFVVFNLAESGFIKIPKKGFKKRIKQVVDGVEKLLDIPIPSDALAERILPEGIPFVEEINDALDACVRPQVWTTRSGFKFLLSGCFEDGSGGGEDGGDAGGDAGGGEEEEEEEYTLNFRKLKVGFHWPTLLSNYTVDDPTLVDLDDSSHPFAALVRARDKVGDTPVQNQRLLPNIGEIDARGIIKIREDERPFILKVADEGPSKVEPGQPISYTITVGNPSGDPLQNIVVTDVLSFRPANPDGTFGAPVEISRQTFEVAEVPAHEGVTLTVDAVAPATYGLLVNAVESTCGECPPAPAVETEVTSELEIEKELISAADVPGEDGAPDKILAGTVATYRITVRNVGERPAPDVVLTDLAVAGSDATGTTVRFNAPFDLGTIEPGDEAEQEVSIAIPLTDAGRQLLNRASVNVPDVDPAEVRNDIIGADLVITKTLVSPDGGVTALLARGAIATYDVTVTNVGTAEATNVTFTDTASIDGTIIEGPTSYDIGTLAPAESRSVTVTLGVPLDPEVIVPCPTLCFSVPLNLTNLAQVFREGVPGVVTSTTNRAINPTLRVTTAFVEPALGSQPVPGGSLVAYRIVVENIDQLAATGVVVTDVARVGTTVISEQSIALGTIEPGERREVMVRLLLPRGFSGQQLRNEATTNYRQEPAVDVRAILDAEVLVSHVLVTPSAGVLTTPGSPDLVLAGNTVEYDVTVANLGAAVSPSFTLTSAVIVETRDADGAPTLAATLPAQVFPIGGIAPGANTTFRFAVAIPAGAVGRLISRLVPSVTGIGSSGTDHGLVDLAGLLVTEMVLSPQQDWNDSEGGNGSPFDSTPGTGTVDSEDVWVEITSPTTSNQNWRVVLTDADGTAHEQPFGPPDATPGASVRVISGFGPMTLPIRKVEVLDDTDAVRQTLDIDAIDANYNPVSGPDDESLTWTVDGLPSPTLQQFQRRPATIGVFSPF